MIRKVMFLILIVCVVVFTTATEITWAENKDTPRVVQMTVTPAPQPAEALKYQLLPEFLDQTPGNAALLYHVAAAEIPNDHGELIKKMRDWLDMPIEKLPQKEALDAISNFGQALYQLNLAAYREYCDWQLPIRTEGYSLLMPSLSKFKTLGTTLALKARLQIAQEQYDEALNTLRNGFAFAGHIGENNPALIQNLVAIGITRLLIREIENFVQAPQAPNLYWALTSLPRPFIDMRNSMETEKSMLYIQFPQLRDIETAKLTKQQALALWNEIVGLIEGNSKAYDLDEKMVVAAMMKLYPQAKRQLIAQGHSPQEMEAMPVIQVVLIYQLQQYNHMADEIFKWFRAPYLQARDGLEKAEQHLSQLVSETRENMMRNYFLDLLPALGKAYYVEVQLDRDIAILRCVEAVRMYAADHNGKLPATLGEITKVPVPLDPLSGNEFIYKIVDGKAIIESPAASPKDALHYELTIRQ